MAVLAYPGTLLAQGVTISNGAAEGRLTVGAGVDGSYSTIRLMTGTTKYRWLIGANFNIDQQFEITASTAVGGTAFTSPIVLISGATGLVTLGASLLVGGGCAIHGAVTLGQASAPSQAISDASVIGLKSAYSDASLASVKTGHRFYVEQAGGYATSLSAVKGFAQATHTALTTANLFGGDFAAEMNGAGGTATSVYGLEAAAGIRAGTVGTLTGLLARTYSISGNPTNAVGIQVADITVGSVLNYAIYTGAGVVRFGDAVAAASSMTVAGGFGCNTKAAQAAYASGGALSAYGAGANGFDTAGNASALYAMVVAIRAALVANGIMS